MRFNDINLGNQGTFLLLPFAVASVTFFTSAKARLAYGTTSFKTPTFFRIRETTTLGSLENHRDMVPCLQAGRGASSRSNDLGGTAHATLKMARRTLRDPNDLTFFTIGHQEQTAIEISSHVAQSTQMGKQYFFCNHRLATDN